MCWILNGGATGVRGIDETLLPATWKKNIFHSIQQNSEIPTKQQKKRGGRGYKKGNTGWTNLPT